MAIFFAAAGGGSMARIRAKSQDLLRNPPKNRRHCGKKDTTGLPQRHKGVSALELPPDSAIMRLTASWRFRPNIGPGRRGLRTGTSNVFAEGEIRNFGCWTAVVWLYAGDHL